MKQASKIFSHLPDFALPFVTRSLRGGRGKRYVALSALLALMTLVLGTWMAVGNGPMERDLRVGLDIEESRWQREQTEFVIIADADWEYQDIREEIAVAKAFSASDHQAFLRAAGNDELAFANSHQFETYGRVAYAIRGAYHDVERAARSVPPNREARVLRDRAAAYLGIQDQVSDVPPVQDEYGYGEHEFEYEWYSPDSVAHLESVLDRGLIPEVEHYGSPLGVKGAIQFVGAFAAWILAGLCFVAAPVGTSIGHAREVHNNTLQPLTGTAMTPRELSRGLRAGYLAPLFIFAVPQAAIALTCGVLVGNFLALPFMALILAAGAYALVSLAQLFAHVAGSRRTPGMVAIGMLSFVSMAGIFGMVMGFDADKDFLGAFGSVPTAGFTITQRMAFGNELGLELMQLAAITFGAAGWAIIGLLVSKVVANRISGVEGPALGRMPAMLGAAVSAGLVTMTFAPVIHFGHISREEPTVFFFLGLMTLAVPYAALLMARVPMSEAPTSMRELRLSPLLGELFAMVGAYMAISTAWIGFEAFNVFTSPVSIFYAAWGIAVVGLVATRTAVAAPQKIWTHIGLGWCGLCVFVAGIHAAMWSLPGEQAKAEHLIATWQLSPILGMLQLVCIFAVPLLLVRGLKRRFASLS